MQPAAIIFALVSSAAVQCPNQDNVRLRLKLEGEECGGSCGSLGVCASGLQCIVPKSSGINFAILLAPARPGVCTMVAPIDEETKGKEARRLASPGAGSAVNVTDAEVVAAARAGIEFVVRERQNNGENAFLTVLSVRRGTQQIVAGVKYLLVVTVTDGQDHYIEVLDQAWRTPRYALLAHEVGAKVVRRLKLLGEEGHGIWQQRPQVEEPVKEAKEMAAKEMEK